MTALPPEAASSAASCAPFCECGAFRAKAIQSPLLLITYPQYSLVFVPLHERQRSILGSGLFKRFRCDYDLPRLPPARQAAPRSAGERARGGGLSYRAGLRV